MDGSTEKMWTLQELADYLKVPKQTVYQMNWRGSGPRSYKVGRHRRYDPADVRTWLVARSSDAEGAR